MSEIYNPLPDTSPSVLRQLARIEKMRRRNDLARAIVRGILYAVFALALGVMTVTFCCAFSMPSMPY